MFRNRNILHSLQTSGDAPRNANEVTEFPGQCHSSKNVLHKTGKQQKKWTYLLKLNRDQISSLNRQITLKKIETVIESLPASSLQNTRARQF